MFEVSTFLTTTVVGLVVWLIVRVILGDKWKNKPPGPTGLPIIGNLHQLARGGTPVEVLQKWKKSYGDVVGFRLGPYKVVVLSGYDTIKEAYDTWDFSGRPFLAPFKVITEGEKRGLTFSEGQTWTEQRRFALRNLRDFGFGKRSMESFIKEDITELLEHFKGLEGQAFVPHRKFSMAVLKSLWNIITGERFTYGDPKFQNVIDGISSVVSQANLNTPALFFPWVATLFPEMTGWAQFERSIGNAKALISGYITEHQKSFQDDTIPRDYLDTYLKEINETTDPNNSFYKGKGEKHLLIGTLNLFAAGSETTSNTLVWALLYLIKNPEIQEKLYQEICTICGTSRLPSLDDRDKCIYTWAVMEEVFRISSLTPFGVFHNTMNDVTFKGHFIPKDTMIMSNLYGIHYDPNTWGDVHQFRPERFLKENADGKLIKNPKAGPVVAFSIGKRVCLGEVLARNNFFLYLTSLVQKFQFTTNEKSLDTEGTPGLIRLPKDFKIILKER